MLLAAGIVASVSILAGRSSAPALIFPQQVAIACGAANGEIAILKADGVFTGGAAVTLSDTVQPAIAKVCAVGATVTAPDLQTIVNTTLPAIKALVDASSLQKQGRSGCGDRYGVAFNVAISMNQAVAEPPAAASTRLAGRAL
ncbi:hypothetical protein IMT09_07180 [Burkholderia cepacia]|uniref:hypothetical protein n=1 Tax=Burkholderia cepacia TaxID=292 RepID=UPI001866D110|nr:hypothetical protein [Burkholderia cepacia]MBE2967890.1 hypothetical protein [Burkholderia cepacia]